MEQFEDNVESIGEETIREFFEDEEILYKSEVKIFNLKNDTKKHRKADFYLSDYKIYVEYFGLWNNDRAKKEYMEKKAVYKTNNVPCIYLYPSDLITLKSSFYRKLHVLLKGKKQDYLLYKSIMNMQKSNITLYLIILSLITIFYVMQESNTNKYLGLFLAIVVLILLIQDVNKILKRKKLIEKYLAKRKNSSNTLYGSSNKNT